MLFASTSCLIAVFSFFHIYLLPVFEYCCLVLAMIHSSVRLNSPALRWPTLQLLWVPSAFGSHWSSYFFPSLGLLMSLPLSLSPVSLLRLYGFQSFTGCRQSGMWYLFHFLLRPFFKLCSTYYAHITPLSLFHPVLLCHLHTIYISCPLFWLSFIFCHGRLTIVFVVWLWHDDVCIQWCSLHSRQVSGYTWWFVCCYCFLPSLAELY